MTTHRGQPAAHMRILVAEVDAGRRSWLESCLGRLGQVRSYTRGLELLADLDAEAKPGGSAPGVVIVGEACSDLDRTALLSALGERGEALRAHNLAVFLASSDNTRTLNPDAVPEDLPIQYALDQRLSDEHIRTLVARSARVTSVDDTAPSNRDAAARLTRILDIARDLAGIDDLGDMGLALQAAVCESVDADRAHCLFHDAERGILWSEDDREGHEDELGAFHGLAGFAARIGEPAYAARASDDPRYERNIDDPPGTGDESLAVQPIAESDGTVHAVLVAVRSGEPFATTEQARLADLAEHAAPSVHQLSLRAEAEAILTRGPDDIFRAEARDAYVSRGRSGDVVRVLPPWVRWAYWLLLALLAIGAVYLVVGRVDEYSVGPSVVRMSGRSDVTAHVPGKVVAVEAVPGQSVHAGQVLARLYDAAEAAELERFERDLHAQLRARMLDPADPTARAAVSSLRADVRRARARLEERTIRAPNAGRVADIRVRPGQHVGPGDLVASLVADATELSVIALLPGADRPKLRPGMSLRMELAGYRYAYQDLVIHKVSDEIIGPGEARRYLGKRLGDGIAIGGPVVVVEAKLPASIFEAHGKMYSYHDGMQGRAEIRTRARRIIVALIPPLEEL